MNIVNDISSNLRKCWCVSVLWGRMKLSGDIVLKLKNAVDVTDTHPRLF